MEPLFPGLGMEPSPAVAYRFRCCSGAGTLDLLCLTLHHRHADLALRERVSFTPGDGHRFLSSLLLQPAVREALLVSTCNRSEIYVVCAPESCPDLTSLLANEKNLPRQELAHAAELLQGELAVEHLLRLACGLESLALGETEILGQLKEAYRRAAEDGHAGAVLHQLCQRAFTIAKRVRTDTAIGRHRVSVASLAVEEIARRLPELASLRVGVWGTGPVGRATVSALAKKGVRSGIVISRQLHRAQVLTGAWNGTARTRDAVPEVLAECDLFISCTGAPGIVIDSNTLGQRTRPLLLVDLALPRDVDPAVRRLPKVDLLDLDDLGGTQQRNLDARQEARDRVAPLLSAEAKQLWQCLNARQSERCVASWRCESERILAEEHARLLAEHPYLSDEARDALIDLGRRLIDRLLDRSSKTIACAVREGLPCGDLFAEATAEGEHPDPVATPTDAETDEPA